MSDVRVYKDDTKEHTRLRRRVRKLEGLLIQWLGLEEQLFQAITDQEVNKVGERIEQHCARVRRALFR